MAAKGELPGSAFKEELVLQIEEWQLPDAGFSGQS